MDISKLQSPAMLPQVATRPPEQAATPVFKPDLRPTADAAALSRNPNPPVPAPLAPWAGRLTLPNGDATTQSVTAPKEIAKVERVERVLKPFGVVMLPQPRGADEMKAAQERYADTAQRDRPETGIDPAERRAAAPEREPEARSRRDGPARQDEQAPAPRDRHAESRHKRHRDD